MEPTVVEPKRKIKTPSFILELPLKTTLVDEHQIDKRLNVLRNIYNACLSESLRRLDLMRNSEEYQNARKLPKGKERSATFKLINEEYDFTEYGMKNHSTKIRNGANWIRDLANSQLCQTAAKRAFKAVQKKAFGQSKRVRFKGKNQFDSIEGTTNTQGLIFKNNCLHWGNLKISCIVDQTDEYLKYGLEHRIKYCRIVRRRINNRNRYYLQLVLEGKPYQNLDNKIAEGFVGLDIGPSTIAYVGNKSAVLKQLCSEIVPDWKEKRNLQRKLDRSRRATNPQNFNENGTCKKGVKVWTKSKRYKKLQTKIAETERKMAAHRKSLHGQLANEILSVGNKIHTEKISYKAWQKMYGKSIGRGAPSMIVSTIQRKAENAHGGYLYEIPTRTTKLSQTCHECGSQVKKPLSTRWHNCCDIHAQRDLYSAFLARCVDKNGVLDIALAKQLWPSAEPLLKDAVSRIELMYSQSATCGDLIPKSFGIQRSKSGSYSKSVGTTIKVADVSKENVGIIETRETSGA